MQNFMLLSSMNPCPCGYYGDAERACTCSSGMIQRYRKRLSGPLLDRIDLHIEVPRVNYDKLTQDTRGESSTSIRARVEAARQRQLARLSPAGLVCNADMGPGEVREFCALQSDGQALIRSAMRQMHLSARGYHRVLKLGRSIADLAGDHEIQAAHLAEALQYRPKTELI